MTPQTRKFYADFEMGVGTSGRAVRTFSLYRSRRPREQGPEGAAFAGAACACIHQPLLVPWLLRFATSRRRKTNET